jgi:hypothetical protein
MSSTVNVPALENPPAWLTEWFICSTPLVVVLDTVERMSVPDELVTFPFGPIKMSASSTNHVPVEGSCSVPPTSYRPPDSVAPERLVSELPSTSVPNHA